MAAQKVYSIQINGLTESVKAVDALNESLKQLEGRINALQGKAVNVGAKASASNTSALNEEAKLQKQIEQTEAKRAAYGKEIYQEYLAAKDLLKEQVNDQKQIAAAERLQTKTYSNTVAGMKQELSDLKQLMQTIDLGDTDQFDKMVKRANELNDALKKIEESYGQFGRNVGNYQSAFDGLQKISVTIGGISREFNSAREASRTLKNELIGLETAGSGNTEVAKQLRSEFYKLSSAMDDATKSSKAMDEAMDWMESFTAMASIGNGLKAFFGVDNSEIQRSIQKLVSLQNVLQGIEKIRKQMETTEGIGKLFSVGSSQIDLFVSKLTGAELTMNGLTTATKAGTVAVRAFSTALKGIGVGLVIAGINMLMQSFEKLISKMDSSNIQLQRLDEGLKNLDAAYESKLNELSSGLLKKGITNEEYLSELYKTQNDYINQSINLLKQRSSLISDTGLFDYTEPGNYNTKFTGKKMESPQTIVAQDWFTDWDKIKLYIKDIDEARNAFNKLNSALDENKDYFDKYGEGFEDWLSSLLTTVKTTDDALRGVGNLILSDFIGNLQEAHTKYTEALERAKKGEAGAKEEAEKLRLEIVKLANEMNNDDILRSIIINLDKYIPEEGVRKVLSKILDHFRNFTNSVGELTEEQIHFWNNKRIAGMKEGEEKILAQEEEDKRHEIAMYGDSQEHIDIIEKEHAQKRLERQKKLGKQRLQEAKANGKKLEEAERELQNAIIQNMKDGLAKTLAQLDEERRQKLQKVRDNGIKVGELTIEINKLYDKKVLDAKKQWAADMEKVYDDMFSAIQANNRQTLNMEADTARVNVANRRSAHKTERGQDILKDNLGNYDKLQEYYDKVLELEQQFADRETAIEGERLSKEYDYEKQEEELRHKRVADAKTTALVMEELVKAPEPSDSDWAEMEKRLQDKLQGMNGTLVDAYNSGKLSFKDFCKFVEDEQNSFNSRMNALEKKYNAQSKQNTQQGLDEKKSLVNNYYRETLETIQKKEGEVAERMSKQPQTDKGGWGTINIGATRTSYDKAISEYEGFIKELTQKKEQLKKDLDAKKIDEKDAFMRNEEYDKAIKNYENAINQIKLKNDNLLSQFQQSINQYIQAGLQAIQEIMNSVADYQDYKFDKEQEALDKENDALKEKLGEQAQIIADHKQKVDSIEDELATARGDRRQHLIDQLNNEIAAQRAARKEEQKLQKEKEKAEKKQEALDKKRKEAEYKRNLMSIIVSTAMATANGLATQPFIPVGIAMGALATTLGMVQYALAAQQKPYAKGGQLDGGVAVGNRHRDGGIKVLGGRAEIEGGEFITNRQTTSKNIELLDYINSKKKKIDVSDMLDFYNRGGVKTSIRRVKTRFEDGGYLPTLPNNLDIKEQLQDVIINQDNRPIYVSVVDINNKQEDVRRVQTLAGL